jgi:hypothetical protein
MIDEPQEESNTTFNITVNRDRDGFLRRTCPLCGRDFKTECSAADTVSILEPHIQRVGAEFGVPLSAEAPGDRKGKDHVTLKCPYCGRESETSDTLTEETLTYLKRFVIREVIAPIAKKLLSAIGDSFGGSRSSDGFISFEFRYKRSILSPRPIHGPDPADMKIIDLQCCKKKVKISENWNGMEACPFCKVQIAII